MLKILWIVDGVGWGYDNLSRAIGKELINYEHETIAKKFVRVIVDGQSGFVCESDKDFMNRIDKIDADIIVSMNPMNKRFLRDKSKAIIRFSGMRALNGWRR